MVLLVIFELSALDLVREPFTVRAIDQVLLSEFNPLTGEFISGKK